MATMSTPEGSESHTVVPGLFAEPGTYMVTETLTQTGRLAGITYTKQGTDWVEIERHGPHGEYLRTEYHSID